MTSADRIVGGEDAPSPIPWQVSVRSGSFHFCGATILDASTLLCAAHCFYQSSASGKSIRAGSVQKGSGGQVSCGKLTLEKMFVHIFYILGPKYCINNLEYQLRICI
jgi:secreted trypsin-like serine protease